MSGRQGNPNWKKGGKSPNPHGRPQRGTDLVNARAYGKIEFEKALHKYIFSTKDQLKDFVRNPATTAMDLFIISVIMRGITMSDLAKFNFLLERMGIYKQDDTGGGVNVHAYLMRLMHDNYNA